MLSAPMPQDANATPPLVDAVRHNPPNSAEALTSVQVPLGRCWNAQAF